ncbi:MAG: hypothetical protein F4059_06110 [Gemmatimonadetes bacterium]|nr:hypothetical protein [Gemmatimonadota bacterium]
MSAVKTEAILLRTHPYSESSRILRFFTLELGLVSVIAKGGQRGASRGYGGAGAFSEGVAVFVFRETRDLQTLREFQPVNSRFGLARDDFAACRGVGRGGTRAAAHVAGAECRALPGNLRGARPARGRTPGRGAGPGAGPGLDHRAHAWVRPRAGRMSLLWPPSRCRGDGVVRNAGGRRRRFVLPVVGRSSPDRTARPRAAEAAPRRRRSQ